MAQFLTDYETVDSRIHKFWEKHPNGRINTSAECWLVAGTQCCGATDVFFDDFFILSLVLWIIIDFNAPHDFAE